MTQVTRQDKATFGSKLGASFRGELIDADHPAYEETRRSLLFNGMHERHPAVIARCTCPGDVRAALAWARANGLLVAVRGEAIRRRDTRAATAGS